MSFSAPLSAFLFSAFSLLAHFLLLAPLCATLGFAVAQVEKRVFRVQLWRKNGDGPRRQSRLIVIFHGKSRFFACSEPFSAPLSAFSFHAFTAFSAFFHLAPLVR